MHPILFELGGLKIYSYGAMISLAILIATILLFRESPREGINPDHILEAVIVAAVGGLLGSRILYVALNWHLFSGRLLDIFFSRMEGLTFYGAFLGGALALLLWSRIRKAQFLKLADLTAPYLALGYAFGRVGCFLNGCCYGAVSDVPWALPVSMMDSILRHPVQLYASLGGLLIFIILKLLRPVRPFVGFNLIALGFFYGALRFATEFFREEHAVWLGLSLAQLFSLALALCALTLLLIVLTAGRGKSRKASSR